MGPRRLHRWLLGLVLACAPTPPPSPPPARVASPPAPPPEPAPEPPPPSRTVPLRFETRTIGPRADHEGPRWVGRPIDLDVKDADLHDVLRLLSDVGHANIVVEGDVSGRVTVRMKHVPWDQALDVVARAKGLVVERDGSVLLVMRAR